MTDATDGRFTDGETRYCHHCGCDTYHDTDGTCYGTVCEGLVWEEVTYDELIAEIDLLIELDNKSGL